MFISMRAERSSVQKNYEHPGVAPISRREFFIIRSHDSWVYVNGTDPDFILSRTVNSAEFCPYNNNNN